LKVNQSENLATGILDSKLRWFVVATGCFAAIAGSFRFGLASACVPSFMIVGAIVQRRFPHPGRVLVSAGAIALSYWVVTAAFMPIETGPVNHHPDEFALALASALLVALCDLAIVFEEAKIRRVQTKQKTEAAPLSRQIRWLAGATGFVTGLTFFFVYGLGFLSIFLIVGALVGGRFPRSGKELTWFGAGVVSVCLLPIGVYILLADRAGGGDPRVIVSMAASVFLIALCDTALLTEIISRKRTRTPLNRAVPFPD
jgi:hypothetical protein